MRLSLARQPLLFSRVSVDVISQKWGSNFDLDPDLDLDFYPDLYSDLDPLLRPDPCPDIDLGFNLKFYINRGL